MSYDETSKNHEPVNHSNLDRDYITIKARRKKRVLKALSKLEKESRVLNTKKNKIRKNARINTNEVVEFASFISSISNKKLPSFVQTEITLKKSRSSSYEESNALNSTKS
jgi:hypothetical protein